MTTIGRVTLTTTAGALALMGGAAWAQAAAPVALADASGIEDIVVTAQRVEERLQDIPLSVTAIGNKALRDANITDVTRLEQLVPGLRIGRSGSDARPAIRGVFTEAIGANSDPRIGFYIDDIYQSRTSQALAAFVDVARVEVQKGPQGTLYGRNSFGGNIAITTNAPSDRFEGGLDALYGRFNRFRGEGFVNVPITEGIAARIAGSYERQDNYVTNSSTGSGLGDEDAYFVRGSLRVAPTGSGLEIVLRGSYYDQGGNGISAFGYKSAGSLADPALVRKPGETLTLPNGRVLTFTNGFNGNSFSGGSFANPIATKINSRFRDGIPDFNGADLGVPIELDPYRINFDTVTIRDTDQKQFSGRIEYDFGPVTARSITSYSDFYANRSSDNDFYIVPVAIDYNQTKVQTFTQEIQLLSSDKSSPVQWIIGGYYFDDKIEERFFSDNFVTYPGPGFPTVNLFSNTYLPTTPIPNARSDNLSPVRATTKSYAGFVQASWNVTERLRVTGGYRYTVDEKGYAAGVGQGATQNPATPTIAPYLAFDLNQPVNYTCNPAGGTQLGGNNPALPSSTALNQPNGFGINCGQAKFKFSTWRGAIDFKVAEDNLIYTSVSRGIRSGGFNNVLAPAGTPNVAPGEVIPFYPEEVIAYEVGTKNRFLDNSLQLNAAFFYNDFKNLQVQTSVPSPSGLTVLSIVTNAGKSRAYGLELEMIAKPIRNLTVQAAFNWLNARDTEFVTGTGSNGLCNAGIIGAGGCLPLPAFANAAAPTAAEIAARQAILQNNAIGVGLQGTPFPNPVTDPARFEQVFLTLPNGTVVPAVQGGNLPVYNYIVAGKLKDGRVIRQQTPLSPEFTVQAGISYDIELGSIGRLTPSVQTFLSGSFINTALQPNFGRQKAFTKTEARLTFTSADDRYTIQAYIENIEDTAVLTRVALGANRSLNAVYQLPQTYGVRAGVRF